MRTIMLILVIAASPSASIEQETPGEQSPLSWQANLDFTNAYFFRGIIQQDHGLIVQPAARATLRVGASSDESLSLDAFVGQWSSVGSNGGRMDSDLAHLWYECDLFAGLTLKRGPLALTASYTFLTSPADAFETVQELGLTLALDDSGTLGDFALRPSATLVMETGANASDGADSNPGTYLELGIAPGLTFATLERDVTLTFPVTVGLSLHNYYENTAGDDETFGFVQVAARAAMPLFPADTGAPVTLNLSAALLLLGDHTSAYNHHHETEAIFSIGLQLSF